MVATELRQLNHSLSLQIKTLEQLKLFDDNEIKAIVYNRNQFFDKPLKNDGLSCQIILEYLRYELDLLSLIREMKVDGTLLKKKNMVTYASGNCLNKLFSVLTKHFSMELQIWFLYIKFCQQMKDTITLLDVVENLLKVHKEKPCVFQLASRCAREDLKNLEKARDYVLMGIQMHENSCELYREAFLLELSVCQQENEKNGNIKDGAAGGASIKMIEHVYSAALMKIQSVDFFLDLYHSIRELPFAHAIKTRIHEDLRNKFANEETMWNALAKIKREELKATNVQATFKDIINEIVEIFKCAIEKVNTQSIWLMYVDHIHDIYNDAWVALPTFKKNCLIRALTSAHKRKQLTDKYYVIWAELKSNADDQLVPLNFGLSILPSSILLWSNVIMNRFKEGKVDDAKKLFLDALGKFEGQYASASLPLWKLMLRYYQCMNPQSVKELFEDAILEKNGVAADMKPVYLEWVIISQGIIKARMLYDRISITPPVSILLHEKMIEMENYQAQINIKSLRKCYSLATQQFGARDISVWMKYIQFENNYGRSKKKILQIKDNAREVLQPALVDEFNAELRLYMIGCMTSSKQQFAIQKLTESLCPRTSNNHYYGKLKSRQLNKSD